MQERYCEQAGEQYPAPVVLSVQRRRWQEHRLKYQRSAKRLQNDQEQAPRDAAQGPPRVLQSPRFPAGLAGSVRCQADDQRRSIDEIADAKPRDERQVEAGTTPLLRRSRLPTFRVAAAVDQTKGSWRAMPIVQLSMSRSKGVSLLAAGQQERMPAPAHARWPGRLTLRKRISARREHTPGRGARFGQG